MSRAAISPLQFAILIVAAYLGAGIFQFPRDIVAVAGDNALYAYLAEVALALSGMWLWFRVNRLSPSKQVGAIARDVATPLVSIPLVLFTVVLHLALLVYATANFALVMHAFFMNETPFSALALPIILAAAAVAWHDVTPLARSLEIIVIPTMTLSFLMGLLVLPHAAETYALVPGTHIYLGSIARATWRGWYIFWGYELTVTLYPFVRADKRAQAERFTYIGMLMSAALLAFGYAITMSAEGPYLLARSQWPAVSTMRIINATSFLVNKLGLFVIVLWGLIVMAFGATRLWCLGHDVLPHLPKSGTVYYYRGAVAAFALLGFLWVLDLNSPPKLEHFAQSLVMPAMWIYNFAVPALLLAVAWIRSHIVRAWAPSTA